MKSKILFSVSLNFFIILVHAQNADFKSVKTNYLNFPVADLSNLSSYTVNIFPEPNTLVVEDIRLKRNLKDKLQAGQDRINGAVVYNFLNYKPLMGVATNADVSIDIAFAKFEVLSKTVKEYTIPCTLKGQDANLNNIKECPAYYYSVSYSMPSVIKVTDKTGKIIHFEHKSENDTISYGYSQLSGHLQLAQLEAAYNNPNTAPTMAKAAMKSKIEQSIIPIQKLLSFYKEDLKLEIATGSGKGLEYAELTTTQTAVVDALANYKKAGIDPSTILTSALSIWNKELATADLNNKQARINRKVAVGLLRNKVIAYLYLYDLANAEKTMAELNKTFEGMFNQTDKVDLIKLEEKVAEMKKTQAAFPSNRTLTKSPAVEGEKIIEKMMMETKAPVFNPIKAGIKYPELKAEYEKYTGMASDAGKKAKPEDSFAGALSTMISAGTAAENKNYKSRVVSSGGENSLKMFPFAGDNFTSLPIEVCALTELTELNVTGIDVLTTLPDELGNLSNLKKLNLYSNSNLKSIPASIGKLTKLEQLDLSGCSTLTDLPTEIESLKNLKKLTVKGSGISAARLAALKAALPNCKIK